MHKGARLQTSGYKEQMDEALWSYMYGFTMKKFWKRRLEKDRVEEGGRQEDTDCHTMKKD